MPYRDYDFESVYTEELLPYQEYVNPDVKCLQNTRTTKAGEMLEIQSFLAFLDRRDYSRVKKQKPTRKAQADLNDRIASQKIVRLTNANFTKKDLWGTFGWDFEQMPETIEEAYRQTVNFITRINYWCKKLSHPLVKYLYVIESTEGNQEKGEPAIKFHLHIILSCKLSRDQIEDLWHGGQYPQTRRLEIKDFGGLTGLATYITKCPEGKRRWGQSKGLKQWTRKPMNSFHTFSRRQVEKMAWNRNGLKEVFERKFKGYAYSEQYPCTIRYNEQVGGYYLYCRMYRKPEPTEKKQWGKSESHAKRRKGVDSP